MTLVDAAKAITDDMDARYEAFAKAEAFLLDHAFAVPFSISSRSYQMCDLNVFEGQYAAYGQASNRYKGQWIYTTPMSQEMFDSEMAKWQQQVSAK
jgi:oligopeptide transport system substrate-binding protein